MSSARDAQSFAICDWLEVAIAPGAVPSELTVQKVLTYYPLRCKCAATYDINSGGLRSKVSVKERFFNGSFRYLPGEGALEYRKRFDVFGIASAHVWSRWDLSRRRASSSFSEGGAGGAGGGLWWRPRVGCGLALGDLPPGGALLSAARLSVLLLRPLSYSFKSCLPLSNNLRIKAYCDSTLRLPRRLSLWVDAHGAGGEAFDEEEEGGGGGGGGFGSFGTGGGGGGPSPGGLLLRLRKTAIVLDL